MTAPIIYLDADDAWVRFLSGPILYRMQDRERWARTGTKTPDEARLAYRANLMAVPLEHRDLVQQQAQTAQRFLSVCAPSVLRWPPWRIVTLRGNMDWGFPYTVSDTIVLPYESLDRIDAETLLHEQIHVLQRAAPDSFARAFAHMWGFRRLQQPVPVPDQLAQVLVTNPDGCDNPWWVFPYRGSWWCALSVLARTPPAKVVAATVEVREDPPGSGQFVPLMAPSGHPFLLKDPAGPFGGLGQPYHPNELWAHWICNMFSRNSIPAEDVRSLRDTLTDAVAEGAHLQPGPRTASAGSFLSGTGIWIA